MTVEEEDSILLESLSLHLKHNVKKYTLINTFSTKKCVSVVDKPKHEKPVLSTKTTHLCILFSPHKIPLLAVEIFSYLTFFKSHVEKLVYVSKADTTGLDSDRCVDVGSFISEYLKRVCKIPLRQLLKNVKVNDNSLNKAAKNDSKSGKMFLSETQFKLHVLERRYAGDKNVKSTNKSKRITAIDYLKLQGIDTDIFATNQLHVKLVLFTRSEGQYLFPGSMENSGKHILDGNRLLKWWLKNTNLLSSSWKSCERFLNILNFEEREINRYLSGLSNEWKPGNVYDSESNMNQPAIYSIPLLPDDPKGRFLEHLVVEGRAKNVKSKEYWQELAVRQEFSFGAIVGLIGITGEVHQELDISHCSIRPFEAQQIMQLLITKNYSDQSDWCQLFTEIDNLKFVKLFQLSGDMRELQKKKTEMIEPIKVNTLLCVRKKAKKIDTKMNIQISH